MVDLVRSTNYHALMRVGRPMQMAALVLLPLGMLLEISGSLGQLFGVSHLVYMLAFGVILFCLGRILDGYGM